MEINLDEFDNEMFRGMNISSTIPNGWIEEMVIGERYFMNGVHWPIYQWKFWDEPIEYKTRLKRIQKIIRKRIDKVKKVISDIPDANVTAENRMKQLWIANLLYHQQIAGLYAA